jgi:arylformamidase
MNILDISLPMQTGVPSWPGKTPLVLHSQTNLLHGDSCTTHSISLDIHLGTHLDAPSHFIIGGSTIDQIPLDVTIGQCRVIEFDGPLGSEIPGRIIDGCVSERVLFKTRNSHLLSSPTFESSFISLSEELANRLVEKQVRLVGIDYFSVDRFGSQNLPVHHILLQSGIVILEGINLRRIAPGTYRLITLPLNIVGAEGSPVRAALTNEGC